MTKKKGEINPICGERLKTIIKDEKISQKVFAKHICCSPEHLSAIINGKKRLTEETAREVVKIFPEYRLEWLLGFDECKTARDIWKKHCRETDEKINIEHKRIKAFTAYLYSLGFEIGFNRMLDETDLGEFEKLGIEPEENPVFKIVDKETQKEISFEIDVKGEYRKAVREKMKDFSALKIIEEKTEKKAIVSKEKYEETMKEIEDFIVFKMQRFLSNADKEG